MFWKCVNVGLILAELLSIIKPESGIWSVHITLKFTVNVDSCQYLKWLQQETDEYSLKKLALFAFQQPKFWTKLLTFCFYFSLRKKSPRVSRYRKTSYKNPRALFHTSYEIGLWSVVTMVMLIKIWKQNVWKYEGST